jgi:hypothetical protein
VRFEPKISGFEQTKEVHALRLPSHCDRVVMTTIIIIIAINRGFLSGKNRSVYLCIRPCRPIWLSDLNEGVANVTFSEDSKNDQRVKYG